jgi:hypothetical protein
MTHWVVAHRDHQMNPVIAFGRQNFAGHVLFVQALHDDDDGGLFGVV